MDKRKKRDYTLFARTGHFPECWSHGCESTRCDMARFVSRWEKPSVVETK